MAEAEDVLTDIARHATVYTRKLWRQYQAPPDSPPALRLTDVAERLNLLIHSAFKNAYPIRTSQPPTPPTLLARWFRHAQSPWCTHALPATDGQAIWLPADLHLADIATTQRFYRTLALQQAMRAQRNSAAYLTQLENPFLLDVFLLLEAKAADDALIQLFPGMKTGISALRQTVLARRPAISSFSAARQPLEIFYRDLLSESKDIALPCSAQIASPEELTQNAKKVSQALMKSSVQFSTRIYSARPLLKDWWTGDLRPQDSNSPVTILLDTEESERTEAARSAQLPRRPEIREATEDEKKEKKNDDAWMVQGDESHPKAEDPMGLQRPTDRDMDTNPEEFADLVSELDQASLVSTPGKSKEVLLSEDGLSKRSQSRQPLSTANVIELSYPEWDYQLADYRHPGATVCLSKATAGSQHWVDQTLEKHRSLIALIQRQFSLLRARPVVQRKQQDGEEIDLDAYVHSYSDLRAGDAFDEDIYQTRRTSDRSVAITLLIDISGSTDSWIANSRRVIDVEREALLLVSIALQSLGDPYSILAFSGEGPQAVFVREVKLFKEPYNNDVALRVSSLAPERYTRVGAALRHATARLMETMADHRLLILLSDGKPNDNDSYEGRYGIEDTRQAVVEAKSQGIQPFCLTIDRQAASYMPAVFGPRQYALLHNPEQLPSVLVEWMKRLLIN